VFEFPSDRTRNASEMAVVQLGGHPVSITGGEVGLDVRETAEDVVRTLACYHSVIAARVARHSTLERMNGALEASGFEVPVINLLSNEEHPTQALADMMTIRREFGSLENLKLAYVGDANNVCRSLIWGSALSGATISVATPEGFGPEDAFLAGLPSSARVELTTSPQSAVADADVVYTDVWVSMGQEGAEEKRMAFEGYTVDAALVAKAKPRAIVLHCLPAHRGEEITAEVLESRQSRIWLEAENRMHAMRGLLEFLVEAK
jgi:ornithine carbamoyltransferase